MQENKILAVVEGKEITEGTVQKFLNELGPQVAMQFQSPEGIKNVVDELVNQEVFYLEALENEIEKEEGFLQELNKFKESIIKQYALNSFLSKISVTEDEILEYYNQNKDNYKIPEAVTASHILVEDEDKAKDVIKEINEGLSFEDAANKYSSCPSKAKGGNLGEFTKGQMVPEFETAAFSLELNTISEPVKTQFGYHILKVTAKKEETLSTFDEVKDEVTKQATTAKQRQALAKKINELKEKYEVVYNM